MIVHHWFNSLSVQHCMSNDMCVVYVCLKNIIFKNIISARKCILLNVHHMLTFVLTLLIDFRLKNQFKLPLPWPSCMTLLYYRSQTYSRLSGVFENPTKESNIIEVGQLVQEIRHLLYFPWMTEAILKCGPYRCLKMCYLRFLFS